MSALAIHMWRRPRRPVEQAPSLTNFPYEEADPHELGWFAHNGEESPFWRDEEAPRPGLHLIRGGV